MTVWNHDDAGWGGWLLMSLGMVAFWVVAAGAVLVLVGRLRDDRRDRSGDEARRLLDERLARGDLDEAEYRSRRDLLGSGR